MRRHKDRRDNDIATPFTLEHPGHRAARLSHLLFEEVDRLFRMEVRDRRLQELVITSLNLSPDLRNAKVYYALPSWPDKADPGRERALADSLDRVRPFLRARIVEALSTKRAPDLHFHRDRMAEASLRAEAVLQQERLARGAGPGEAPGEVSEVGEVGEVSDGPSPPAAAG